MIEGGIRPHNRVMALRAQRSREARRNVIRHRPAKGRRAVPGGLVAAVAIRIRGCKRVVVIEVAVRAKIHFPRGRHLVRTEKWPARSTVVKRGGQERDRVMTVRAIRRGKGCACRRVHGIVRSLPAAAVVGIQMTLRVAAVRGTNRQGVIVVDVAVRASADLARWRHLVRIR